MAPHLILKKAGPLRNGAELGKGSVYHAVPVHSVHGGRQRPDWKALCGAYPAIMWSTEEGDAVTCHRCLKKLEKER